MPVTLIYNTEQELIDYLHLYLGDEITTVLALVTDPPSALYQQAVNEALRLLRIELVDQATGSLMELAAHVSIWRRVQRAYMLKFNFSADGGSYNVGDVWDHIRTMLAAAESEAIAVGIITSGETSTRLKTKIVW